MPWKMRFAAFGAHHSQLSEASTITATTTRSSGDAVSNGPYATNHECQDLVSTPATTCAVPVLPAISTALVVMTGPAVPFVMTPRRACWTVWKDAWLMGDW